MHLCPWPRDFFVSLNLHFTSANNNLDHAEKEFAAVELQPVHSITGLRLLRLEQVVEKATPKKVGLIFFKNNNAIRKLNRGETRNRRETIL